MVKIISQKIVETIDQKHINKVVEQAFRADGLGKTQMPPKSYLYFSKGDLRSMPAYINTKSMNIAGIKSVNVHPENKKCGLPTVMAKTLLTDPEDGRVIAIVEATHLTAMRTGAAGAIAIKYLANKKCEVFGLIGAGAQSRTQLEASMLVKRFKVVKIYDISEETALEFGKWAEKKFGVVALVCKRPEDACTDVDVLTTVTPSSKPVVKKSWISPGTHINAIGADAKGKQELFTDLTCSAKVFVDNWDQASHSGEINIPVSRQKLVKKDIVGELGKIVSGSKTFNRKQKDITIFDSTGLAIQDVSSAFFVYKHCLKNNLGKDIEMM